jgi:hypothetical protein
VPQSGVQLQVRDDIYVVSQPIEDLVVISVPPTCSGSSVEGLVEVLEPIYEKVGRSILVLTHNVSFLKVTKLRQNEATAIRRQVGLSGGSDEKKSDSKTSQNTNSEITCNCSSEAEGENRCYDGCGSGQNHSKDVGNDDSSGSDGD